MSRLLTSHTTQHLALPRQEPFESSAEPGNLDRIFTHRRGS